MTRRALASVLALLACGPAAAEGRFRRVLITDGDTVTLSASAGPVVGWRLRMLGIDTPEANSKCAEERRVAAAAATRLRELTANGVRVVSELEPDAYGRLLARLYDRQGRDLSEVMKAEGHARPLAGGQARKPWCAADGSLIR